MDTHVDATAHIDGHALGAKSAALLASRCARGRHSTGGIHDPMPGELRTRGDFAERAPDQSRATRESGFERDLTVARDLSAGHRIDGREDALPDRVGTGRHA